MTRNSKRKLDAREQEELAKLRKAHGRISLPGRHYDMPRCEPTQLHECHDDCRCCALLSAAVRSNHRACFCCRRPRPRRPGRALRRFEAQAQALASWAAEALVLAYEDGKRPLCAEAHAVLLDAQKTGTVPDKVQVTTRAKPEDFERDILVPAQAWWACANTVTGSLGPGAWHGRAP